MPLIVKYGNSPIVEPLNGRATCPAFALLPGGRGFGARRHRREPGRHFRRQLWCDDWNPNIKEIKFRPQEGHEGAVFRCGRGSIAAAEIRRPESRFVIRAPRSAAANNFLGFQSNRDFMMNSVNWLSADEDLDLDPAHAARIPAPRDERSPDARLLVLGVFGVPIIIIFAGIMVWYQRR